jgi:hypothetical protein
MQQSHGAARSDAFAPFCPVSHCRVPTKVPTKSDAKTGWLVPNYLAGVRLGINVLYRPRHQPNAYKGSAAQRSRICFALAVAALSRNDKSVPVET